MEVVGQAGNGQEALEKVRALRPDLVLMDIHMPRLNGLEATRIIKAELPDTKVVMVTVSDAEENLFVDAIKSGAEGYILKNVPGEEFANLLSNLARGQPAMSAGLARRLLTEFAQGKAAARVQDGEEELTVREREVLQEVSTGKTNREVGAVLFVSEETVKYHLKNIMQKLHLRNRAEVVAWAIRHDHYRGER